MTFVSSAVDLDKPQFKADFSSSILFTPSMVKCSLFSIKLTILTQRSKSTFFWVSKEYFLKWGIILVFKSLILFTLKLAASLVCLMFTLPQPKNSLILYNIATSLECRPISNVGLTV